MIKQPFGFVSTCFGHGKTGRRASDDSGLQLCSVSESLLAHSKLMIYLYVTVSLACLWMQCAQSCLVCEMVTVIPEDIAWPPGWPVTIVLTRSKFLNLHAVRVLELAVGMCPGVTPSKTAIRVRLAVSSPGPPARRTRMAVLDDESRMPLGTVTSAVGWLCGSP